MTRRNEKRVFNPVDAPPLADVVPFEKPQNPAQRSIRVRVQERLDRERERIKPRISPVRLVVTLAVALIPVMLTYGAADYVVRRVQLLTKLYTSGAQKQVVSPEEQPVESEIPGVVMTIPDPSVPPVAEQPADPPAPPQGK